jgi:hypothetical protein
MNLQNKFSGCFFPSGSFYIFLENKDVLKSHKAEIEEFINSQNQPTRVKFIFSNSSFESSQIKFQNYQTTDYQTNFLSLNKQNKFTLQNSNLLNWQKNYQINFVIKKVNPNLKQDYELVKDYILNSFGVNFIKQDGVLTGISDEFKTTKIEQNFDKSIFDKRLLNYYIIDKEGLNVAFFSLFNFNQQTYLQSVSGLTSQPSSTQKKLPILLSGIVELLNFDSKFVNTQELIFSNSHPKVTQSYKDLGAFEAVEIAGLVLKKAF